MAIRLALLLLFCAPLAYSQGVRIGDNYPVTSSITTPGQISTVSGSIVNICNFPANGVPCTNKATTYTSITLGTPCSTSTQIVLAGTSACIGSTDARGNWGAWVASANYDFTITTSTGQSFGPWTISAGNGSVGSLTVNLASPGTGGGLVSLGGTLNLAMPVCVAAGGSHAPGLVPDTGAGVDLTKFLRSDCTFSTPAGSGNVSNTGSPAVHQVTVWTNSTTIEGIPVCTNNQVLHGVTGADPACSAIVLADLPLIPLASQVSGQLPIANTCPGTTGASSTTFLRGDCQWITPAGAGNTNTIANGTASLGTGAISSGTCASVVTVAATGTATTDDFMADFNADPTGVTGYAPSVNGMLTIIKYPTTNNVNFKVCNNTSSSVTPGAITLNWRVVR